MQQYSLSKVACLKPFKTIEIHTDGDVSLCCFSWLPYFCGNITESSIQEIFDNVLRNEILSNMQSGVFSHCNDRCPHINMYMASGVATNRLVAKDTLQTNLNRIPWDIHFTYDQSCNLECKSCRSELILHKLGSNSKLQQIHDKSVKLVEYLLSVGETVTVHVTGSGDAFASPLFWNYLKELSENVPERLRIELITNGTLMTPSRLDTIRPLLPTISMINVSIDAAKSETYSKVRKNGNFARLIENLNYLDTLTIKWMSNFTVQKDNFRDLPEFVKWQLSYTKIKSIALGGVSQWGHLTDDEFQDMAVWKTEHPDNTELRQILTDPVFQNNKVKLGNLTKLKY